MSGNVVSILAQSPHKAGNAICLHCKHEWVAVAPIDEMTLDCPKCNLGKGVYKYLVAPNDDTFQCNCGNYHFHITPDFDMCTLCGNTYNARSNL